ncbi:hypothetical protein [Sedimenticola selenatireducens]|uniref:hypothetical protein n=1 Tax=Sedimenticola selenatireducens TaxID=191960 RepID=UPI001642458D|nr:hypothetical protein [Sedimenticola selenatireducens]
MREGGRFERKGDELKKVEGTQDHPEGNRPRVAEDQPVDLAQKPQPKDKKAKG